MDGLKHFLLKSFMLWTGFQVQYLMELQLVDGWSAESEPGQVFAVAFNI
jgi:hypothetical protein